MAKASLIALVSMAVCLASLSFAYGDDTFSVEGKVYCDTCRFEFETRISEPIPGATVILECRNRSNDVLTYSKESKTDELGLYTIPVEGDHEEEICDVRAEKSPEKDCNEPMESWAKARVLLTKKDGVSDSVRYANSLAFLRKEPYPECAQILKELGIGK